MLLRHLVYGANKPFKAMSTLAWRQTPFQGSLHSQTEQLRLKCKNIFIGTHFATSSDIYIAKCLAFVAGALLYRSSPKQFENRMFKIRSDARTSFQMASWATPRVVVRNKQLNHGTRCDVIIVWRNTHNNTKSNANWFPLMLTDTDLNIQGIQVKYHTYENSNIPATESRLWGTSWHYLFSAPVYMLRRGAFGNFSTKVFNGTIKNCVPRRGSSKGYVHPKQSIIRGDAKWYRPGLIDNWQRYCFKYNSDRNKTTWYGWYFFTEISRWRPSQKRRAAA